MASEKKGPPSLLERLQETAEIREWALKSLDKLESELETFYQRKKAEFKALREIIG